MTSFLYFSVCSCLYVCMHVDGITKLPRLVLKSGPSCFSISLAVITGECHYTQFQGLLLYWVKTDSMHTRATAPSCLPDPSHVPFTFPALQSFYVLWLHKVHWSLEIGSSWSFPIPMFPSQFPCSIFRGGGRRQLTSEHLINGRQALYYWLYS